MAREFANTAGSPTIDGISYPVPAIAGLATCSIVIRGRFDSDTPSSGLIFWISDAGTLNGCGLLRVTTGSEMYAIWRNSDASTTRFPFTFNGSSASIISTFDGAASPKTSVYVDGVSQTILSPPVAATLGSGHTYCVIGAKTTSTVLAGFNGVVAEAAIYNRVITPAEAAMHAAGFSCLNFPRGLIFYAPLIREVHDIVGGLTGTVTGTTVSEHPRIYA